jgi:hypothetical protein
MGRAAILYEIRYASAVRMGAATMSNHNFRTEQSYEAEIATLREATICRCGDHTSAENPPLCVNCAAALQWKIAALRGEVERLQTIINDNGMHDFKRLEAEKLELRAEIATLRKEVERLTKCSECWGTFHPGNYDGDVTKCPVCGGLCPQSSAKIAYQSIQGLVHIREAEIATLRGDLLDYREQVEFIAKELGNAGVMITEGPYDGVMALINECYDLRREVNEWKNRVAPEQQMIRDQLEAVTREIATLRDELNAVQRYNVDVMYERDTLRGEVERLEKSNKWQYQRIIELKKQEDDYLHGQAEIATLRTFIRALFEASHWPDGGDIDCGTFEELAVEHGILTPKTVTAPCEDNCFCADYHGTEDMADGVKCYKKAKWLINAIDEKPQG